MSDRTPLFVEFDKKSFNNYLKLLTQFRQIFIKVSTHLFNGHSRLFISIEKCYAHFILLERFFLNMQKSCKLYIVRSTKNYRNQTQLFLQDSLVYYFKVYVLQTTENHKTFIGLPNTADASYSLKC
jgi:hypothetical protein